MKLLRCLCVLLLGLSPAAQLTRTEAAAPRGFVRGGHAYAVDHWGTADGLPGSSVISMTLSREGYLWLGTLYGLVRFDGVRFTVFDESNTPGLPSSRIVCLFEDREGVLWVGTETGGAALIRDGRATGLDLGRGRREGRLMSVCQDASGAVWLYTADGELARHEDGQVNVWKVDATSYSRTRALAPRADGSVWVGTDWRLYGVSAMEAGVGQDLPMERTLPLGRLELLIPSNRGGVWAMAGRHVQRWTASGLAQDWGEFPWGRSLPSAACEDRASNLWVGTLGGGLYWFDEAGQAMRLSREQGLSHDYILSLLVDGEEDVWVGTDGGGLNRIKRQDFEVLEGTQDRVVQTVGEDASGNLWVGYNQGGLDRWQEGRRERIVPQPATPDLAVRSLLADREGRLWVGTWGAGVMRWEGEGFVRPPGAEVLHPVVTAIFQDRAGVLWFGTGGGLGRWDGTRWSVLTSRDGLSADVVRALAEGPDGLLWVGTEGGGLNGYQDGMWRVWRKGDGLPADDVTSLWVDPAGGVWLGTPGGGLGRFDGRVWTRFTTQEGLASNSLGSMVEDGGGFLWVASNAGVTRLPWARAEEIAEGTAVDLDVRIFGLADGLPDVECTLGSQPGAFRSRDGRLWFPTVSGLASADPGRIRKNRRPPPVVIEAVLVEGKLQNTNRMAVRWESPVVVPPGRERIELQYTSLNLRAPERARFRVWLEGHETTWTDVGGGRVARYPKLPPGDYTFRVTAANEDGVWNEAGTRLAIRVLPYFWQTNWFWRSLVGLLLVGVAAAVYFVSTQRLQRRLAGLEQQQALERERARIARDLHDQLGASLTQIALLGEMAETDKTLPEEVESHARQITQTSRDTTRVLDEIVWAVNPQNDTLDGLVTYLCKNAQEYLAVAGVRCRLEIPAQLPGTPLPPDIRHNVFLAAKEAVTNIVRHAQATEARLGLRVSGRGFVLEICDNGRGLGGLDPEAAARRHGLGNMRKRMQDIHGRLVLEPGPEGGTRVQLEVPLI